MNIQVATASARAQLGTAATYDGFYLRDNLASKGQVPALSPFSLSPDIIGSAVPIPNAQTALSSQDSWQTIYEVKPAPGANYYYVRGLNGSSQPFQGQVSLYCVPAQLLLFPSLWKNSPLTTANGLDTVSVSASPGHIGVGNDAYVLQWPAAQSQASNSTFCSFIAQNTAGPIPAINDWLALSQLLTQQLNFGWRNSVTFDPVADDGMLQRIGLSVPPSVSESATLQIIVTATGMAGDTISLLGDCFTPEQRQIVLLPAKLSDPYSAGLVVTLDPGFQSSLAIQYWNTSGNVPAPGASLTVTVNYVVPTSRIERAVSLGVLSSGYSRAASRQLGVTVGPQQVAPVGAVTFVVGSSGP
jgi:hypothetical protein